MKLTLPSPNAKRVKIGAQYQRPWFERRNSDGSYQARMPGMSVTDERLQRALLAEKRRA